MTVIAGYVTPDTAAIAGDTLIIANNTCNEVPTKVHRLGPLLVGWCGYTAAQEFIRELDVAVLGEDPRTAPTAFCRAWRAWATERRLWEITGDGYPVAWLILTPGTVWTITGDGTLSELAGDRWAMGQGEDHAIVALDLLQGTPAEVVRGAVEAAIRRSPMCGGRVVVEALAVQGRESR